MSAKETSATQNNLKSDTELLVERIGTNEINIASIENAEPNDFNVDIQLKTIDLTSECSDGDEFKIVYALLDKHSVQLCKDSEKSYLIVDERISIKIRSSLADLIAYFKRIFSLPVELYSSEKLLGKNG